MKQAPLSPEKMQAFQEFVWRAMGRLGSAQWRDLLDHNSELGQTARAYYADLAEGKPWEAMAEYLAPVGSAALPEHAAGDDAPPRPDRPSRG